MLILSFVLAAFNGAYIYAYEPKGEHIDYETHRYRGGGMDLELRDLNFTYPEGEKPSLKGVNLKIAAGETVAIVSHMARQSPNNPGGRQWIRQDDHGTI